MTTVAKKIKISGVGIHSGLPVDMVIKPSKNPGVFCHCWIGFKGVNEQFRRQR